MNRSDVEQFQTLLNDVYREMSHTEEDKIAKVDKAQLSALTSQIANTVSFLPFVPMIELRPSPIHGTGVFATCKIPKFTMVTFYPGDIGECTPAQKTKKGTVRTCSTFSKRFQARYDSTETQSRFEFLRRDCKYSLQVDSTNCIMADPLFQDNICYVGHFVNDRFKPDGQKITNTIYEKLSTSRSNCAYYKFTNALHVGILTTREIEPNEELFVTYGSFYWDLQISR